jgi:hypothetical protein
LFSTIFEQTSAESASGTARSQRFTRQTLLPQALAATVVEEILRGTKSLPSILQPGAGLARSLSL